MHIEEEVRAHSELRQRNETFKRFGYDSEESTAFVIERSLPLGDEVLEIGTGRGRFLLALAQYGKLITTVDIDAEAQQTARLCARHEGVDQRITFLLMDAYHLDFPSHSFDCVATMNTMHHIENALKVVGEMVRLVRPTGKMVISDFNEDGFRVFDRVHQAEGLVHNRINHNFDDIERFLEAFGWKCSRYNGCNQEVIVAVRNPHQQATNSAAPAGNLHDRSS